MRKFTLALLALGLVAATTAFASNPVRISQIYGGNGNSWNQDYVELFNSSASPVSIAGWTLQYGSAATTTGFGTITVFTLPTGATIPACGYYLIGLTSSTTGTALPVTPDASTTAINLSSTSGKLLLHTGTPAATPCLGNSLPHPASWMDQVGYGTGAGLCYETTAAPVISTTTTAVRAAGGMTDSDNNSTNFSSLTSSTNPPRNSTSGLNPACAPVTGACCVRDTIPGTCHIYTPAECAARGGIYLGNGVPCDPVPCETPAIKTTWGRLKSIYR